ncbi:P22 phage major capsid protein family protein [Acrocarpospora macrocephala]|uniref:Bacteriophage protein n=1 Tax=Acrocarpospora macrocephala TaxID=150177 RepID=A0A5M3WEA0_9ACTN|nr:P22 coat protein - protein 5 domain protein [Acrocarpospora macrocephala]GES07415.1 bacteriophage protein [Acrocarpospora macrocephala]
MAITRFRPEIWSALLLTSLKKAHIYAALCNRDYEGEITAAGDTVRVTSVSRPTVNTYSRNTDIAYEELTDAQRTLVVDQEKYWAFSLDDVDKAQAKGDVMGPAMEESGYAVNDVVDSYVAGLYTQAAAANAIGTVSVTTGDIAYTQIRLLGLRLTKASVPRAGRWAVLPPFMASLLLENGKFVNNANPGVNSSAHLIEGWIGRALGFDLYESNNAPLVTGDDYAVLAGNNRAITFASQITRTEALRSEVRFADRMRGLYVYGAKVMRPDGLATLVASET